MHVETTAEAVHISPLTIKDVFNLYRLEKRCFPVDSWPFIDVLYAVMTSRLVRFKAMLDGQMVGFVLGQYEKKAGWIASFGVDPLYRNRGIGTSLLHTLEHNMEQPRYKLCVRKSNESAIRLYQRNGFRIVDTWSRYYKGGEDALVMEKRV